MLIAFSIAHMGLGGAQRVTLNLIRWIQKNTNHDVLLVIESTKLKSEFQYPLDDIRYFNLPDNTLSKIKELRQILKQYKPDVLVTMGLPNSVFDTPACAGISVRHIVSERNDPRNFKGKFITKWLSRLLAYFAKGYVFQTDDAKAFYDRLNFKQGIVIPNPLVDLSLLPAKPFEGEREHTIVAVGRLNTQKNYPLLIEAFEKVHPFYPDYKLCIYGEGTEKQLLINTITSKGLNDNVILAGSVDDVANKIYRSSLFVLSSDFEGMPNALMEAMAVGLPCISTDCPCGGPKTLMSEHHSGILVPVGDVRALSLAILNVLGDKALSQELSANAFKIRQSYNIDIISQKWLSYIEYINSTK